ncbi:MAG: translation initiation factor IF-2 N-terminal domain-containing protein, partial [Hydrogenobacter thermophilus]|nr:translation initiation factor IF-2 N-terminal domain-containing protein [Hydrogenobacter thermophilus]
MSKVRLQDVAKELGKSVKDIRDLLKTYGIEKSNFSHLEEEELQIIYDNFITEKEEDIQQKPQEMKKEEIKVEKREERPLQVESSKRYRREDARPPLRDKKEVKPKPQQKAPPPPPPLPKEQKVEEKPKREAPVEKKTSKEEEHLLKKLEQQIEK